MSKTYNRDAYGLPSSAVRQINAWKLPLTYTRHALGEALNDRYGVLPASAFPQEFTMYGGWSVVEVEELEPGYVTKIVVRKPIDGNRSLVLVITNQGLVKTLWTNLNSDVHSTLDKSKFAKP